MSENIVGKPVLKKNRLIKEYENSLRDFLIVLFRHKILIVVSFFTISILAVIITLLTPEVYLSYAQILIRVGRENIALDPTVGGQILGMYTEKDKETLSEVAIISSVIIAERVVEKYGPEFILNCSDQINSRSPGQSGQKNRWDTGLYDHNDPVFRSAVSVLQGSLSVVHRKETNLIDLSYMGGNPRCSQLFLNEMMDFYLERHIEINKMLATPLFFQEQSAQLYSDLASKEEELKLFKAENNIVNIDEQKKSLLRQIEYLQNSLDSVTGLALSSEAKVAEFEKNLKFQNPSKELHRTMGHSNYVAKDMRDQLIGLRLEESKLASRYQDNYRPLIEVRHEIDYIESLLVQEPETRTQVTLGVNEVHQAVEHNLELEKANSRFQMVQQEAVAYELLQRQHEVNVLAEKELDLARLQRDIKMLESEYISYRDNLRRAKISTALDMSKVSNVRILQPATLPMFHIKPKRKINVAIGLLLGFFVGIGLALVLEFFDDTMKTNEDVEKKLGLPVLAFVSKEEFESCT
ncbi:MAG: GumC family protein [Desulfobulbaceae bacterium]|nr:GumC family protein [Desulfobulbaceae bacterium]